MTDIKDAAVEQVIDTSAQVARAFTRNDVRYAAAAGAAGGLLIGTSAGWLGAKHRYRAYFQAVADEQIDQMREHFYQNELRALKQGVFSTPQGAASALGVEVEVPPAVADPEVLDKVEEILEREEYSDLDVESVVVEEVTVTRNIFDNQVDDDEADGSGAYGPRDPHNPYLVSVVELQEERAEEIEKVSLTYFEGDDTLIDDRSRVIPSNNRHDVVGEANLSMFGTVEGEDPDTIYVRNEARHTLYEITREPGKYTVEILKMREEDLNPEQRNRRPVRQLSE